MQLGVLQALAFLCVQSHRTVLHYTVNADGVMINRPAISPRKFVGALPSPAAAISLPQDLAKAISLQISASACKQRGQIGLCLLTIAKRVVINLYLMSRAAQVALALLAIFLITYVLVTPDPTDDATAVLQVSHFGKAQMHAVYVVLLLAPQIAIFRLSTPSSSNQQQSTTLELVDLFCTYRC